MQYQLGILGAGNMAEAIVRAAIDKKILRPDQIIAADPSDQRRAVFAKLGVTTLADNQQVITGAGQILLAVKPQTTSQVAADIGKHLADSQIIVSIMAGVTTQKLGQAIAEQGRVSRPRIIRVMPNTPLQIGLGMAGVALGPHAKPGDDDLTMKLFAAGGRVVRVAESDLDAVTAISGSGPAYVFYLAEAMIQAAGELGLAQHADVLVKQTILGAAQLMIDAADPPQQLRRRVTSPGGTTEAAINHLDANKTAQTLVDAIKAAAQRSQQLGT